MIVGLMDLDWEKATEPERAVLYRACKSLLFKRRIDWQELRRAALGPNHSVGQGWERTFYNGRISRQVAETIYEWMTRVEPELAAAVRREILALRGAPPDNWENLLARVGRSGSMEIVCNPSERKHSIPDPERESQQTQQQIQMWTPLDAAPRVPVGVPFCIDMLVERDGVSFGFQFVRGRWTWLPLDFVNFGAMTYRGVASFPLHAVQLVLDKLYVEYEPGPHRLAVVTVPLDFANENKTYLSPKFELSSAGLEILTDVLSGLALHEIQVSLLNPHFI